MPTASDSTANHHGFAGYRHEYRCRECGYGVAIAEPPASCPMCSRAVWMWTSSAPAPEIRIERLANGRAVVAPMGPLEDTGRAALRTAVTLFAARGIEVLVDLGELAQSVLKAPLLQELAEIAEDVDASLVASSDAAAVDVLRADAG